MGYSRQALFQKNWAELTHPDDLAADVALFEQMLAGEIDSYSLEKRFIRPDGSAVPCLLIGGRSRRTEISAEFFYVQIIDLSERKQMEDAPLLRWRIELDALPPLPQRTVLQCIRILQEAIANALNHARAHAIDIDCVLAAGILRLAVRDDGIGLPEKPRQGRGLSNLTRRAREMGAMLDLQSGPSGVTVALRLPLCDEPRPI